MTQITHRFVSETGQRITAYVITATTEEWAARPESSSPLWSAFASGKSVSALAVDVDGFGVTSDVSVSLVADARRN